MSNYQPPKPTKTAEECKVVVPILKPEEIGAAAYVRNSSDQPMGIPHVCQGCLDFSMQAEEQEAPVMARMPKLDILSNMWARKMTTNEGRDLIANDLTNFYSTRIGWLQTLIDPRRDYDIECGYPRFIVPNQYQYMYDRIGTAKRVNDIYPDESWAVDPKIYENNEEEDTPFEQDWKELLLSAHRNPLAFMHRADVQSGIGRYGALLFGIDDGMPLSSPAPGLNDRGEPVPIKRRYKLNYFRVFDESLCHIISFERDPDNPRFGQPLFYHMIFADIRVGESSMGLALGATAMNVTMVAQVVHWSRVVHVTENRGTSEVFSPPRAQPVFNNLCDVRKILAGSAEMFWKGGFPGISFEMNPELLAAGAAIGFDKNAMKKEMEDYANGLSRYVSIVGMQAKSLTPQLADPTGNLVGQWNAIALAIGVPLRIFMGSEQAQLASGQDVRTWNRRLAKRQNKYVSPFILRPVVNRLIAYGILRQPKKGPEHYQIEWPDINMPTKDEQSQIADRQAAALFKFGSSGLAGPGGIQLSDFLHFFLGQPRDVVEIIMRNTKANIDGLDIKPPSVQQAEVKPPAAVGFGGDK